MQISSVLTASGHREASTSFGKNKWHIFSKKITTIYLSIIPQTFKKKYNSKYL